MMNKKKDINKIVVKVVLAVFLGTLFTGCVHEKKVKTDPFFTKWKTAAKSSSGYGPVVQKHRVEITKGKPMVFEKKEKVTPEKPLPTMKVTMKMKDVDVSVLLRALAKAADQNIIINEKVQAKANINIKDAPWDQVFRSILSTNSLSYAWEGDIIRIMTAEDMEQDLKREGQKRDFRLVEPLLTRIIQINYSDAAKLKATLSKFLTKSKDGKSRGSIMVDGHTNSLIVQAIKEDIDRIIPLIKRLDRSTPQILIEANIVEATRNTARELGIQWGGLVHNTGGGANNWITPGNNAGVGVVQGNPAGSGDEVVNPASGYAVNFPAASVTGNLGLSIGYVAEKVGKNILAVQLSALQTEGKLNILSSPSITTLDNQKATIESGKEVPYQTVDSNGNINTEYKKAVLSLEVTPHVIDGETLTMNINTTKDELDFANAVAGQPAITTKKAETKVILRDGETTVIGGLNKEKRDNSESGVPVLKDIPLFGWLFKGSSKKKEMEDVLIFITPHILKTQIAGDNQGGSTVIKTNPPKADKMGQPMK